MPRRYCDSKSQSCTLKKTMLMMMMAMIPMMGLLVVGLLVVVLPVVLLVVVVVHYTKNYQWKPEPLVTQTE